MPRSDIEGLADQVVGETETADRAPASPPRAPPTPPRRCRSISIPARRAPSSSVVRRNSRPITAAASSASTAADSGSNRRRTVSRTVSGSGKRTCPWSSRSKAGFPLPLPLPDSNRTTSEVKNGLPSVVSCSAVRSSGGHLRPPWCTTICPSSSVPNPRKLSNVLTRPSSPSSLSTSGRRRAAASWNVAIKRIRGAAHDPADKFEQQQ